jgi:hypothetical protein
MNGRERLKQHRGRETGSSKRSKRRRDRPQTTAIDSAMLSRWPAGSQCADTCPGGVLAVPRTRESLLALIAERLAPCRPVVRIDRHRSKGHAESITQSKQASGKLSDSAVSAQHRQVSSHVFDVWILHRTVKARPMSCPKRLGNDDVDRLTNGCVRCVTEQLFRPSVPAGDPPGHIGSDRRVHVVQC